MMARRRRSHGRDQHAFDPRSGLRAAGAAEQLPEALRDGGPVRDTQQHAADLGLVRDVLGEDLHRHRQADGLGGGDGLFGGGAGMFRQHRHAGLRQQCLGLRLMARAEADRRPLGPAARRRLLQAEHPPRAELARTARVGSSTRMPSASSFALISSTWVMTARPPVGELSAQFEQQRSSGGKRGTFRPICRGRR